MPQPMMPKPKLRDLLKGVVPEFGRPKGQRRELRILVDRSAK
jgi:hypothetical protein